MRGRRPRPSLKAPDVSRETMDTLLATSLAVYGAFVIGLVSPGPDFVLVTALALGRGARDALAAAAGIACGVGLWVIAAWLGLGTLIETAPRLWEGARLAGGGLLIYMGARVLSVVIRNPATAIPDPAQKAGVPPLLLGLLTSLANPKAAIVLVGLTAVLTESLPDRGLLMVMVFGMPLLTLAWFSLLATVLARPAFRDRLLSQKRVLDTAVGVVLAGVGIVLIQAAGSG